jgi:hypothetical protein
VMVVMVVMVVMTMNDASPLAGEAGA